MKILTRSLFIILFICSAPGCDNLKDIAPALSDSEIAQGLKEALNVGIDTTVKYVSAPGGYFNDALLKILLPDDVAGLLQKLQSVSPTVYDATVGPYVNNLITSLNSSAEDAAKTATPIFKSAILGMNISDARSILMGEDSAATNYLRIKTYDQLKSAYAPKIDSSLNKPLLLGKSANYYWENLTTYYNSAVDVYNLNPFNSSKLTKIQDQTIGGYTTGKALTGLFLKVKNEEKLIRKDPAQRVTDILQKVFGELDK